MIASKRTIQLRPESPVLTWLIKALCLMGLWVGSSQADVLGDLQAQLKKTNLPIESVADSEVPGLFSLKLSDGTTLLTDVTGTYFIHGDIYRNAMGRMVNLSEQERSDSRKALIDGLDEDQMVVFAPPPSRLKTTITVFTDIDCGYCRKLHQEVPELNRLGIAVRYLAYPRAGIDSVSYDKIVSAWCAPDQKKALTQAKAGESIEAYTCVNPVKAHFELGELVGVTGTPSIVFEDGRLLPGYLPAARLAAQLGLSADS